MAPQTRARTAPYSSALSSSSSSSSSLRQHPPPPSLADIQILHLHPSSTETDEAASGPQTSVLGSSTMAAPMSSSASVDGDVDEAEEEGEEEEEEEDDDADFQSHYSLDAAPLSSTSSSPSSESDHDNNNESSGGNGGDHQRPIPFLSHHSSNLSSFSNSFAPPFYNRPPTPLPPSPSLTSLLRPSFSATNTTSSRPTTPDLSSENDTPNDDTEAAVAKSARIATRVPRASPKVPTYEYYGFVLYLLSSLAFLMYLLWSYLPSPFLHQLGIYYYPNRWWSLAIPSFLVMSLVYIYVALASYNTGHLTLPMSSIENIVDEAADVAVLDEHGEINRRKGGRDGDSNGTAAEDFCPPDIDHDVGDGLDWVGFWSEGTDAVMDVPVGGVCEILYGRGKSSDFCIK